MNVFCRVSQSAKANPTQGEREWGSRLDRKREEMGPRAGTCTKISYGFKQAKLQWFPINSSREKTRIAREPRGGEGPILGIG